MSKVIKYPIPTLVYQRFGPPICGAGDWQLTVNVTLLKNQKDNLLNCAKFSWVSNITVGFTMWLNSDNTFKKDLPIIGQFDNSCGLSSNIGPQMLCIKNADKLSY